MRFRIIGALTVEGASPAVAGATTATPTAATSPAIARAFMCVVLTDT
jgi:hypothetical protein